MAKKLKLNKEVRLRHHFFAWLNRTVVANIIRSKYNFKGEVIKKRRHTPQLVLVNHQSELDPFFVYYVYKAPIYVVANEQITTNPFYGPLLKAFMNAVPIRKGTMDLKVIRRLKQIVSENGSILLFPEGNSTYDGQLCFHLHNPGKLVKLLNIEVVIYNLQGAYLSNPRWSRFRKKGHTFGLIKRVITKEEIAQYSLEELEKIIKENLDVNPYEINTPYKGSKIAEGLQRLIFFCPNCLHLDTLETSENVIHCQNCSFEGVYDEFGYLTIKNKKHMLHEVSRPMIDEFEKYLLSNIKMQFNENVATKVCWGKRRRRLYENISFLLNKDGLSLIGKKINFQIPFNKIIGFGCQQKAKLVIYANGIPTLIIRFEKNISIYKYYIVLQIFSELAKKGEENYELLTHTNLSF